VLCVSIAIEGAYALLPSCRYWNDQAVYRVATRPRLPCIIGTEMIVPYLLWNPRALDEQRQRQKRKKDASPLSHTDAHTQKRTHTGLRTETITHTTPSHVMTNGRGRSENVIARGVTRPPCSLHLGLREEGGGVTRGVGGGGSSRRLY